MPRYRHILRTANRQLSVQFPRKTISLARNTIRTLIFAQLELKISAMFPMLQCITGNYATIANYLGTELRYMDAGE
jgi:hypothetical protein